MKPNEKAKSVLDQILYATLSTVDSSGNPWNSPVYCVYDEAYNLYWASHSESQHSQNIYANGKVFIVVYDSTIPWGEGRGVFIQATAVEVTNPDEIAKACRLRKARVPKANQPPDDFMGDRPRRVYRATPQRMWMNRDSEVNGHFIDIREQAGA
jgi:nitroimidazol reductase NimA-like FMN-containing flavoprotein (pyridoxamine 5'-phosphate oxidase superfamily)